jgi:hypothetical protein
MSSLRFRHTLGVLACMLGLLITSAAALPRWGRTGHEITGRAAAADLPAELPEFFRNAGARLGWLNYEPDRWRDRRFRPMEQAFSYDHYIDIEIVPREALEAADRFTYLALLQRAGMAEPAREAGLLPFHILELYGRLVTGFRRWRDEQDPEARRWIEERVINDAGILGHYIADSANPHHTTVHFNGWAEGWHNPQGYTNDRSFHARFEGAFVDAKVRFEDVRPEVQPARQLQDVRAEVFAHLTRVNGQVDRLYQLEKQEAFGENTRSLAHKAFAVERLADGASLLRSIWFTAWKQSEQI